MLGLCSGSAWSVLGVCLERVWSMFEVCLECVWSVLGCVFDSACSGDERWLWSVFGACWGVLGLQENGKNVNFFFALRAFSVAVCLSVLGF